MKKRFYFESFVVVISLILLLVFIDKIDTSYSRKAKVNSIENDVITFEDENGNFWEWEREKNEREYTIKENVVLKMHTNHTDSIIEDDIIKRVKRED